MAGALTHSPARVVAKLLVDMGQASDGTAASPGTWPAFWGKERDTPDECMTLRDTAPREHARDAWPGGYLQDEGVQLRVRSRTHAVGWAKGSAVLEALNSVAHQTVTVTDPGQPARSYDVWTVDRQGGLIHLGKETPTSARDVFTANLLVTVRQRP